MSVYIPPVLTVDAIIFQLIDNELSVALIKRAVAPFKGKWALPGGYNPAGETTHDAMARIIRNKAGINLSELNLVEQLYTFDTVARDPRGHAVSVTYMGLGTNVTPKGSATTQSPQFFPVNNLPNLAYDHSEIITYAHDRLRNKLAYTNVAFALLPKLFTLTQLQQLYETIFGHDFDKRNFRKKISALDIIEPTDEYLREGAHRPARLYKFAKQTLEPLASELE